MHFKHTEQTFLPPLFLSLLNCRNAVIHILQAGNSSNVKACLGFLFQQVPTLRYTHTQTHTTHPRTLDVYPFCVPVSSVTFPM